MKLIIFLTFICLQVSATAVSQRISISEKNAPLEKVLRSIRKQSGFAFFYSVELLDKSNPVTVKLKDAPLEQVLQECFQDQPLTYKMVNNTIIVQQKEPAAAEKIQAAWVQQLVISGKVVDETNAPLPGVTIQVKGTNIGTTTGVDGGFKLETEGKAITLVVSFVGYNTQEVSIKDNQPSQGINIKLLPAEQVLNEVVVVAFGEQKKSEVVGSMTTIKPSELRVPSSNLTTALAGRAAGVIAYQRSGEPGQDNADFFVRGVTTFGYKKDPLILIDGIELTSTDLARLQTDDIASFSIMKDATATALYGARGANGIILVTTKQGAVGKAKLSFRLENSMSAPTRNVELADPVTYMRLANEAVLTRDPLGVTLYPEEKIANTAAGLNPLVYPANDWRKQLFKEYAMNQRANLNVSGGGSVARYYVAASYSKDNGILKIDKRNNFNSNIDLKKYTLRSNVNIDVTKSTELVIRLSGSFDDYSGPLDGGAGMYNKVMHSNPVLFPAYYPVDEAHKHVSHIMFGNYNEGEYLNPYADMVKGFKDYSRSQMIAQFEVKQDLHGITPGLKAQAMFNTTRNSFFDVNRAYNPYYYAMSYYDPLSGKYSNSLLNEDTGTEYLGYNEGLKTISSDFYYQGSLNYIRTFNNKHTVSGLLVNILTEKLIANAGDLQQSLPYRNLGLSGRATYSFAERYYAEFNFGYNGSERFHRKNRFGFFPSAGLAWSISNEEFWKPYQSTISNLKLRATYGLVGNDAIGSANDRFFYLSVVNMNDASRRAGFGENINTYWKNGVAVNRYANDNITWEVSEKKNIALEVGLWNKVNVIAEYFQEYRRNILMTRAFVPNTMGLSSTIRANTGEASGQGTDISVDYKEDLSNSVWLSARGNFTFATSKFEVFEEPQYTERWRYQAGNALSQTYGYIAEKLFVDEKEVANSPRQFGDYGAGDIKYLDVNRDGNITEADKVPIGNPTSPEIVYGFGFSLGYKNFDFSAFFQGLANESFWIDAAATSPFQNETQLLKAYADNYWSEDNRNIFALWPRLSPTISPNNTQTSTWFMRDGSFTRLKQVELGYNVPKKIQGKLNTSAFRIYLSGTNLFMLSKFNMWDTEMGGNGLGYPIQRTFNAGLNLSF